VAGLALGADDGVVGAGPEEFGLLRRMGVMADRAGFFLDGVLAVHFFEGRRTALMAREAEFRWSHREEIVLCGRVREMALATSLFGENLVHDIVFVLLLFVTVEADCIAFGGQQIRRIRCVRVVARGAILLFQRSMHSRQIEPHVLDRMAFMADLVAFLLEDQLSHDAMSEMATVTFPVPYDVVHVLHR
jgi:hypothetical protein